MQVARFIHLVAISRIGVILHATTGSSEFDANANVCTLRESQPRQGEDTCLFSTNGIIK
ncbi:hypothetical protein M758_9G109300 [Ceratodon purpureus]|uniref:Secreted protein n=1 Tax=Ceratodon purpureus TaxID=3225 RepID=A0A8T0GQE1_CERPU|nr:hypothetical protein KC19_9G094100 [Ceratodon purpureus]KAG0606048.1 hypothetical protein M758_9G109300 [Ceratodon purpureus]